MATRVSLVFQYASSPRAGTTARIHTGGWTESLWSINPVPSNHPDIATWATARARLLPATASIVGFRIANFTIVQNKFKPTGTSTGKIVKPGNPNYDCDIPQMALEIGCTSSEGPNVSRIALRGIPDSCVYGGELNADVGWLGNLTRYLGELENRGWKFTGRDLAQPSFNIISVAGNVVTLNGALGAVPNTSYVRFLNAKNEAGETVTGAYLVTAVAGNTVTIAGYSGGNFTVPSGKMRIDMVRLFDITEADYTRVVVRKVGRPFESYRGRQSKTR